jgi:threonylcarbamoyladenosine tRNA methylthiotransferase MtaB
MKVFLETVGCRLNQAEVEAMAGQFRAAGHEIVATAERADLAVVNTCAVTSAAASDSRSAIRRAALAGARQIVPTGCWATLQPDQALKLPGVERTITNDCKDSLVEELLGVERHSFDAEPMAREPLPGARRRTRLFVKVQDGCDNRCTFCVTTIARGASRSRTTEAVCRDIASAVAGGTQEVVLTGVHLGAWGRDLGTDLYALVRAVLAEARLARLRLSSLEPWDLDAKFFSLWRDPRLCPHLHLPLQSGCASTLRRMARKTTPDSFRRLLESARVAIPDVAITTDVIAGFPGETEAEFEASLEFVQTMHFAGGHAFTYSARPGTVAARRADQVPEAIRRRRTRDYLEAFAEAAERFRRSSVGQTRSVLWESAIPVPGAGWQLAGLTDNYIRVHSRAARPQWNEIAAVELTEIRSDFLQGIITK